MPRLRRLSGDEVVSVLIRFGFQIYSQKGSHAKMRRTLESGRRQNLTVPKAPGIGYGHPPFDLYTGDAVRSRKRLAPALLHGLIRTDPTNELQVLFRKHQR